MTTESDRSAAAAGGARPPIRVVLEQSFDRPSLVSLRNAVAAHGSRLGMSGEAVGHLVLAAYELASNAVRHGGGRGWLRLLVSGDALQCEVRDSGPGFVDTETLGRQLPEPTASGGRGLWLVRCVTRSLEIRSGGDGTVAVAEFALG